MSRRKTHENSTDKKVLVWPTHGYLRLSHEDGHDESYSIGNQRQIIQDYISNHDDLKFEGFYIDDGISGTSEEERPAFQQMMHDILDGKVKCIIVKDLSRPFRNSADQTRFMDETRIRHGVRFISLSLPFIDSVKHPETVNSLTLGFQGLINENHCRETSIKVRDIFDIKRKQGKFIGAFAPYGYMKHPKDKNRLIIDDEAAAVVKDIFNWYCSGMSRNSISQKLNELGIPNPAEYKRRKGFNYKTSSHLSVRSILWQRKAVCDILSNQVYIGTMVQGKEKTQSFKVHDRVHLPKEEWYVVENTHDPIIDKDVFDQVQSLAKQDTRTAPGTKHLHLFAGFIRCADCNRAMYRKKFRDYAYYYCRTYISISKTECTKHSIRESVIYTAVLEAIQMQVKLIDSYADIIAKLNEAPQINKQSARLLAMLRHKEEELKKKKKRVKALYEDMQDGLLTRSEYLDYKEGYQTEIEELKNQISHLQEECKVYEAGIQPNHPYIVYFQEFKSIKELDRLILARLIECIYVHEDGQLEITFKFEDQYQRIVEFIENNKRELHVVKGITA